MAFAEARWKTRSDGDSCFDPAISEHTSFCCPPGDCIRFLALFWFASRPASGVDLLGGPIPGITAMGHHAIGVNPALLATNRPFSRRDGKFEHS